MMDNDTQQTQKTQFSQRTKASEDKHGLTMKIKMTALYRKQIMKPLM